MLSARVFQVRSRPLSLSLSLSLSVTLSLSLARSLSFDLNLLCVPGTCYLSPDVVRAIPVERVRILLRDFETSFVPEVSI